MFEITVFGSSIGLFTALGAGLLSFLSPCILPMVPFYLGYLAGSGTGSLRESSTPAKPRRAVIGALCFAAGILTVFVALGLSATALGQTLRDWIAPLRLLAASVIALMGLHFLGVIRLGLLNRQWRRDAGGAGAGAAYLMGLAFAFGWTPCVGPVLAAILLAAAAEETLLRGGLLLAAYGIGMTAPFVLAAAFTGPFLRWMQRFRPLLPRIEQATGLLLLLFAALIATGGIERLASLLQGLLPALGRLG